MSFCILTTARNMLQSITKCKYYMATTILLKSRNITKCLKQHRCGEMQADSVKSHGNKHITIFPCKYPLYLINIGFELVFSSLQKSSSQKQNADFPGKLDILYFTSVNVFPLLKKCYLQNQHRTVACKLFSVLSADVQTQGRSCFLFNC